MAAQSISDFLTKLKGDLQQSISGSGLDSSGRVANSLRIEEDETTGTLYGWKWIEIRTEYGRRPTSPGSKKGNPTLREAILAWVERKGIGEPKDRKSIAYLISKKIHEQGDRLYRGELGITPPTGILTSVINDGRIDDLKKQIVVELFTELRKN